MSDQISSYPSITFVTEQDIPSLNNLVNSAYRGESSKKGWTTEADLLDGIRTDPDSLKKLINQPDSVILKYVEDSGLIKGCVYLQQKNSQLYLGMLTVSPDLQGKGIGKKLLEAAEFHASKLGCTSIIMTVISVRQELIAWYQRHGYNLTGATEPFPTDPKFGSPKQPLVFLVLEKLLHF